MALQGKESRARLLAMEQTLQHGIEIARAPEVHQAPCMVRSRRTRSQGLPRVASTAASIRSAGARHPRPRKTAVAPPAASQRLDGAYADRSDSSAALACEPRTLQAAALLVPKAGAPHLSTARAPDQTFCVIRLLRCGESAMLLRAAA